MFGIIPKRQNFILGRKNFFNRKTSISPLVTLNERSAFLQLRSMLEKLVSIKFKTI